MENMKDILIRMEKVLVNGMAVMERHRSCLPPELLEEFDSMLGSMTKAHIDVRKFKRAV